LIVAYFKVLKKRNFFFLWLGQIISQFGDRLTQIALVGLVYQKVGARSLELAKILLFTIIPVFLVSPVAGIYVDRWGKKITMAVSDITRGVLILSLGLLFIHAKSFSPVYVVIFIAFCVGRFFIPAKMAIVPAIVDKKDIVMANSLISTTAMIAAVLGFGVGGFIVEWWGARGGFIIDSITFFLSGTLILFVRTSSSGRFHPKDIVKMSKDVVEAERSLFKEFKEGLTYLFSRESTFFSVKMLSVLFSFLGALYVVLIVYIQQTLGTATKDLGIFAVWLSCGLFLGSLIYGRVANRFSLMQTVNFMLSLVSVVLISFVLIIKAYPSGVIASGFSFFLGLLGAPIVIACNSLIHRRGDNDLLGRVFSSLEVVMHFSFVVFMLLASFLADIFSPFAIIITVGIIVFLFSLQSFLKTNG